ncbi:MAG: hypothetical protein WCD44_02360, partial [Candidatus Babeliales bacterium]
MDEDDNVELNGAKLVLKNKKNAKQECCIQFARKIKFFSTTGNHEWVAEDDYFTPKNPFLWLQSDYVRVGLNPKSKGSKKLEVGFKWSKKELASIDAYLDMDKEGREKFFSSISSSEHARILIQLDELQLPADISGLEDGIELLIQKLNVSTLEDIECFLKENDLLFPAEMDKKLRDGLLQGRPEFYENFVDQEDDLVDEIELNESTIIQKYWIVSSFLYDIVLVNIKTQKIIKQFQNVAAVWRLSNNKIAVKYLQSNNKSSVKVYNIKTGKIETELVNVQAIYLLDSDKMAIEYQNKSTEELWVELREIETNRLLLEFADSKIILIDNFRLGIIDTNEFYVRKKAKIKFYNFKEIKEITDEEINIDKMESIPRVDLRMIAI